MRLVAALAGTGPIFTAAGALRAFLVVLTDVRVLAFPLIAPAVLCAIAIDAAFGADTRAVIEIVATEQPIAAVELRAARGAEDATGFAVLAATIVLRNAGVSVAARVARLADQSNAVVTVANHAIRAVGIGEAFALVAPAVFAIAKSPIALAIFAAEFAVGALLASPATEVVYRAVGIGATLGAHAAAPSRAADQIVTAISLRAGATGDGAMLVDALAAGANGDAVAFAALLALAAGADTCSFDAYFAGVFTVGVPATFVRLTDAAVATVAACAAHRIVAAFWSAVVVARSAAADAIRERYGVVTCAVRAYLARLALV